MTRRLLVPTLGPSDWRRLLADSDTQWRERKSAYECAVAWEAARSDPRGLPPAVAALFDANPEFQGTSLLLGIPEHQVILPGGGHASQTDFWALIDTPAGVASLAVEAKAGESFDRQVRDWLKESPRADGRPRRPSGKPSRLAYLCEALGIDVERAQDCRYQLMHRPVAAILEAKRFRLDRAVFLVHAFGANSESFQDFESWGQLLGVEVSAKGLVRVGPRAGVDLWVGWLEAPTASDATVRAAV